MSDYQPNPACRCGRCRTRGLMGPAVLVTLGLLFLLANLSDVPFQRTWPILLIVVGVIKVVRYAMPESGHVNPGQAQPSDAGRYTPAEAVQRTLPAEAERAEAEAVRNEAREPQPDGTVAPSAPMAAEDKVSEENHEVRNG